MAVYGYDALHRLVSPNQVTCIAWDDMFVETLLMSCHMNAIHIVVIVCYCSVGPLRRHHMNRILQELHDGNEWELLGHRE